MCESRRISRGRSAATKAELSALSRGGGARSSVVTEDGSLDLAAKSRLPAIYRDKRTCGSRRAHVLRHELTGHVAARRHLRGQDLERRQARRFASGAADEVRAGHQSQNRKADRPDDSAEVLVRADKVIK